MCHVGDEKAHKVKLDRTELPDEEIIKSLEGEICKYAGGLEADEVMFNEMKDNVEKKLYRRARKVLETKLYSGNVFKAINTWAVSVVRYSATFLG